MHARGKGLPMGDIEPGGTVAEQAADEDSLMNLYRRLIEFRKTALSPQDRVQPWEPSRCAAFRER